MKVCLINPPCLLLSVTSIVVGPPLGLAYIAATLRKAGHEVSVIDAQADGYNIRTEFDEDIILCGLRYDAIAARVPEDADIIGIGCMFTNNWLTNRELIDFLGERFPLATVIAGGEHVTAVPEFCLEQAKHLKICVLGEGEDTIVNVLEAVESKWSLNGVKGIVFRDENNSVINTGRNTRIRGIGDLPWPAWDLFPVEKYSEHKISFGVNKGNIMPLMATRGCPYECTFCSSAQMWTTKYTMRPTHDVADEMEFLYRNYQIVSFDFYDLTAIVNKHWIVEFAQEIIQRKLPITWQIPAGTRSEAIDKNVAEYLYKSGCRNITYAPESGAEEVLKNIKKRVHLPHLLQSIRHSYKSGLNIKLNMILGFPEDKHFHMWQTMWFLIKASWYGAHDMYCTTFFAYPGSELYRQLVANGKIDIRDDGYFIKMLYSDSFPSRMTFKDNMNINVVRFYHMLTFAVFYGSNFLIRPARLFRLILNLIMRKEESRLEHFIRQYIYRKTEKQITIKRPQLAMPPLSNPAII